MTVITRPVPPPVLEEVAEGAVGQRRCRHDALLQVTGQAMYGVDLRAPDMLWAKAVRSPYPHARIVRIDPARALSIPGVVDVVTARDIPYNRYGFTHEDQRVLADDRVRYVGEPVAVVAAETLRLAAEGAQQLIV